MLLGLLHVGVAANVLDRLGVTRDRVREASARLLDATDSDAGLQVMGDGEAEDAVLSARRLATSRGHNLARTEHVLFVLALDPGSSARRVLDDIGVDPARVKKGAQRPDPATAATPAPWPQSRQARPTRSRLLVLRLRRRRPRHGQRTRGQNLQRMHHLGHRDRHDHPRADGPRPLPRRPTARLTVARVDDTRRLMRGG